jgi:hypothetical protein
MSHTSSRTRRTFTIGTLFPLDPAHGHGLLREVSDLVRHHPRLRELRGF